MAEATPNFEEIAETFELFDDWEDRYAYLIDIGKASAGLPEERRTSATKVDGCVSQVWIWPETRAGEDGRLRLYFEGDSDALIVRGLIVVLKSLYDGRPVDEISTVDAGAAFARLGLDQQLSPQRSNGFAAMTRRIKALAQSKN